MNDYIETITSYRGVIYHKISNTFQTDAGYACLWKSNCPELYMLAKWSMHYEDAIFLPVPTDIFEKIFPTGLAMVRVN